MGPTRKCGNICSLITPESISSKAVPPPFPSLKSKRSIQAEVFGVFFSVVEGGRKADWPNQVPREGPMGPVAWGMC